jgi:SAM-dependent methyltransferase
MTGFSASWLALRESIDHRSRDHALEQALAHRFAARDHVVVTDLGCGTGSNLRATFALLPKRQAWTLVDYDAALLGEARAALIRWARLVVADGDTLHLRKGGADIVVTFRQADLARNLDVALGPAPDLVTASAFFDLASHAFIERIASSIAARRAVFYTSLTYNGLQTWLPADAADQAMAAAFRSHQAGDKGFGPAAGPAAPAALRSAFEAAGYRVSEGDSPWQLGVGDQRLLGELATGFSRAVSETKQLPPETVSRWSGLRRTVGMVGHTDTLAVPR